MTTTRINVNEATLETKAGYYKITGKGNGVDSIQFLFVRQPNFINRFFCRVLLGWVWEDNQKIN